MTRLEQGGLSDVYLLTYLSFMRVVSIFWPWEITSGFPAIPKYYLEVREITRESDPVTLAKDRGLNKEEISNPRQNGFYQETVLTVIGATALLVKKKNKAIASISTYAPGAPLGQPPAKILSKSISQDLYT